MSWRPAWAKTKREEKEEKGGRREGGKEERGKEGGGKREGKEERGRESRHPCKAL